MAYDDVDKKHSRVRLHTKATGNAGILYGHDPADPNFTNALKVDANGAILVNPIGSTVSTTAVTNYIANTPTANYAVGDVIRLVEIIDPNTGVVTSQLWNNVTQGTSIPVPPGAHLDLVPTSGITVHTETDTFTATATNAGVGYVIGDTLIKYCQWDNSTNPATAISETWLNLTQGTALVGNAVLGEYGSAEITVRPIESDLAHYVAIIDNAAAGYLRGHELKAEFQYDNNVTPPTIIGQTWTNLTTGLILPAPAIVGEYKWQMIDVPLISTDKYMYFATANNAMGYSIGDQLELEVQWDNSFNPATIITLEWRNLTTGTILGGVPALGEYTHSDITADKITHSEMGHYFATVTNLANGYTVGDQLQLFHQVDNTTTPPIYSYKGGFNLTTGLALPVTPPLGDYNHTTFKRDVMNTQNINYVATATNLASGFTRNDYIQETRQWDNSTQPPTIMSSTWFNITTGLALATSPLANEYSPFETADLAGAISSDVEVGSYVAVVNDTSGAGSFLAGDHLEAFYQFDNTTTPPTIVSQSWKNLTQGTVIGTPTAGDYIFLTSAGASGNDIEGQVFTAIANDSTGLARYSTGDQLYLWHQYDPSTNPPILLSVSGFNLTTGIACGGNPAAVLGEYTVATGGASNDLERSFYKATANNVVGGYALNDQLERVSVWNAGVNPPALISDVWYNFTAGVFLPSPPTAGQYIAIGDAAGTSASIETRTDTFTATATNAIGYTIGDSLERHLQLDNSTAPATILNETWYNLTAGTGVVGAAVLGEYSVAQSTANSLQTETIHYVAIADAGNAEFVIDDHLERTVQWNNATTPPTAVSDVWYNITTGVTLTVAPVATEYELFGGGIKESTEAVNFFRTTAGATIAAGASRVAFYNMGVTDGLIDGTLVPPGYSIDFDTNTEDKLDAIVYDATGTEFMITEIRKV